MTRTTVLWCITVFFGASIVFGALRSATEDSPRGVALAVQVAALTLMIVAIVAIVRRRK